MNKFGECLSKEEVLKNFFESKKNSDDHIQAAERLCQLGCYDDALSLYSIGAQMIQGQNMSYMIRDLETIANTQRTAGVFMKQATDDMKSATSSISRSTESINESSIRMINAAGTISESSIRMNNAAGTIEDASRRIGRY